MPINKHVPVSIVLRPCMREACASVSVCAPEWTYGASGDAIFWIISKNLLHQFAFPHPKMLDCVFTSIGINWLLRFCQSWWIWNVIVTSVTWEMQSNKASIFLRSFSWLSLKCLLLTLAFFFFLACLSFKIDLQFFVESSASSLWVKVQWFHFANIFFYLGVCVHTNTHL